MSEKEYYNIDVDTLDGIGTFPFSIYLYNKTNGEFTCYLEANQPLTDDKRNLLKYIVNNDSGAVSIKTNQKLTYLSTVDTSKSGQSKEKIEEKQKKIELQDEYNNLVKENKSEVPKEPLRKIVSKSIDNDDFSSLIQRAKDEILLLPINKSHTVSLARHFASKHMNQDSITNRIVAFSYFFARKLKVEEEVRIADIICAAFLSNIGLTQISNTIVTGDKRKLSPDQIDQYYKHVGFSKHLISKVHLDITDRCKSIIELHHEKHNGMGYPNKISEAGLTLESQILEVVSHLIEFSSGLITGEKMALSSLVYMVDAKTPIPGLNIEYSTKISDNIKSILNL